MPHRRFAARRCLAVCSSIFSLLNLMPPTAAQSAGYLHVAPVEGEGAFNSIGSGFVHPPAVRVTDEDSQPVAGAQVTFTFPSVGPGVILPGGGSTLTAISDETGLARCPGYKPNIEEGRFRIRALAVYQGKSGSLVINQSNTRAGGGAISEKSGSKKLWIWALVAGGAVGGILAAKGGGSSSSTTTVVPATTLTSGAITVGAPR